MTCTQRARRLHVGSSHAVGRQILNWTQHAALGHDIYERRLHLKLTAVAEMAGMVLRLVVHPHVIRDVSSGQELATDVARDLLLVANHVRAQTVLRGEAGLACLKKRPLSDYGGGSKKNLHTHTRMRK